MRCWANDNGAVERSARGRSGGRRWRTGRRSYRVLARGVTRVDLGGRWGPADRTWHRRNDTRDLGHRRRREQRLWRQVDLQLAHHPRHDGGGLQRVAPQLHEEVIVDAQASRPSTVFPDGAKPASTAVRGAKRSCPAPGASGPREGNAARFTLPPGVSGRVSRTTILAGTMGSGRRWPAPGGSLLTVARLILSMICFVFLAFDSYLIALILFAIAAGTDWVDGYWVRKYGQITQLGRILDPFADKIIICGTFIFLAAVPPSVTGDSASRVTAWMAVIVMGREIRYTLRSFFEEHGTDFSAKWAGKVKMVLQCAAVAASLGRLWWYEYDPGMGWAAGSPPTTGGDLSEWIVKLLVWSSVVSTVYSGWGYVQTALRLLREK